MKTMKVINLNVLSILLIATAIISCTEQPEKKYTAEWSSLEQVEPVPEWFKDAKFGVYFHWGVYSVPAFASEWYPRNMYIEGNKANLHHTEKYGNPEEWPYHYFITGAEDKQGYFMQFAPKLKSEGGKFDPEEWADLIAASGARFAGPVAEHHDGFSMWASEINPWNAKDQAPGMDLVRLLTEEIRKKDMKVILSMHHAFHGFTEKGGQKRSFFDHAPKTDDPELQILYGQLSEKENEELWIGKHKEIIDKYQPDIIWQDFNLPAIREEVLLEFLAYYYNQAEEWNKEVVATYKDGYNKKVAVLDYERGGPVDLTDFYWLTDDAISSSSWCYTEGIGYYSTKAVLHGLLDRISKNGNLLLNISPKADGSIPGEQKEILLALGDWLGKFGEAVYNTRAWVKYGEGPTKMGTGHLHGTDDEDIHLKFEEPLEGTAEDIRFTRSKDEKVLYAIVLGWPGNNETISIKSLSSNDFNLQSLGQVELLGEKNNNKLSYKQDGSGLHITMPGKQSEELAYVIKLEFSNKIPSVL